MPVRCGGFLTVRRAGAIAALALLLSGTPRQAIAGSVEPVVAGCGPAQGGVDAALLWPVQAAKRPAPPGRRPTAEGSDATLSQGYLFAFYACLPVAHARSIGDGQVAIGRARRT